MYKQRLMLIFLLTQSVISCIWVNQTVCASEIYTVEGYVFLEDGSPAIGATVILRRNRVIVNLTYSDDMGHYTIDTSRRYSDLRICVYLDYNYTSGMDYTPLLRNILFSENHLDTNFTIFPAATIFFTGQFVSFEPEVFVENFIFRVVDTEEKVIECNGTQLLYGKNNQLSKYVGIETSEIIIPIDIPLTIKLDITYKTEIHERIYYVGRSYEKIFIKKYSIPVNYSTLKQGDKIILDIRQFIIQEEIPRIQVLKDNITEMISHTESCGFYVTSERIEMDRVYNLIKAGIDFYNQSNYNDAYIDLNTANLKLVDLNKSLLTMFYDAAFSANVLIAFIVLTSLTLAVFTTEDKLRRIMITGTSFFLMILFLYQIYPGTRAQTYEEIALTTAGSFIIIILTATIFPRLFKTKGDEVSFHSTLTAALHIGKKNLRRRKLRSLLTFSTLFTLTMSFIALTSLSTGYGLLVQESGSTLSEYKGILMRMPEYVLTARMDDSIYPWDAGHFYNIHDTPLDWLDRSTGAIGIALKAEKLAQKNAVGIIGFQTDIDPVMPMIDNTVTSGSPLREHGSCLVHESLIGIETEIGGYYMGLKVVGAFDDTIKNVKDVDGKSVAPLKQEHTPVGRTTVFVEALPCKPAEFIITTYETALNFKYVKTSRAVLLYKENIDLIQTAKSMALSSEYRFWAAKEGKVYSAQMGDFILGKGLPIMIPWGIVVLTVITTMLGSMHERRKEINILSSVGLNPGHISEIFLSEALILGIIAGGLGYLLGLGWYPAMAHLNLAPDVRQKVSAIWSIAAVGISLVSVFVGTIFALRGSVVLTPSSIRKWNPQKTMTYNIDHYEILMPIQLEEKNYLEFLDFVKNALEKRKMLESSRRGSPQRGVSHVLRKILHYEGYTSYTLTFGYCEKNQFDLSSNKLVITHSEESDDTEVKLLTSGSGPGVNDAGSLIRRILMEWSAAQGKQQ